MDEVSKRRDEVCQAFFGKTFAELQGEERMAAKMLTHGIAYGRQEKNLFKVKEAKHG